MKKKTIKKKSKTKSKGASKSPRDKKIEKQNPWVKDIPLQERNKFPDKIDELDKYIATLKVRIRDHETSLDILEEEKHFTAYRYGWAVGWYEAYETVLEKLKGFETVNGKVNGKLDTEEYQSNKRFHDWWTQQREYGRELEIERSRNKWKLFEDKDLDTYDAISYSPALNISFDEFNDMVVKYCSRSKRVGFWRANEWGTQTFHFDVKNDAELHEVSKDFQIRKAKRLLEDEGIIIKADKNENV